MKWQSHDHPIAQQKYLDQTPFSRSSSPCCNPCTDQGVLKVQRSVSHNTVAVHACNALPYWFMLKRTRCSAVILEKLFSTHFFLAFLRTQNCSQSDRLLEAIAKQHEAFSFWIKLSTCPYGCWKLKCAILSITIENTRAITWDGYVLNTDHPRTSLNKSRKEITVHGAGTCQSDQDWKPVSLPHIWLGSNSYQYVVRKWLFNHCKVSPDFKD